MTTTAEKSTTNERLARVEAIVESLVSEVSDLRAAERSHFLWLLGILVSIIAPTLLGLLVSLIVLILTLQQ